MGESTGNTLITLCAVIISERLRVDWTGTNTDTF
jgi:hypothetical protein